MRTLVPYIAELTVDSKAIKSRRFTNRFPTKIPLICILLFFCSSFCIKIPYIAELIVGSKAIKPRRFTNRSPTKNL